MREIKFRAWDTYSKAWLNDKISIALSGQMMFEGRPAAGDDALKHLAKNIILTQFTGLPDKNGKEIYEGDTVKVTDPMGVATICDVEMGHGHWSPILMFVPGYTVEIVGTIFSP